MKKILIAKITSAHGIKGEVNVISYCKNEKDLEKFPLIDENNNEIKLKIKSKNKTDQLGNSMLIAKINGVEDRNAAEKFRNKEIFTDRKNFPKAKKNEFYQVDLIGLDVINEEKNKIGKVLAVLDFGAGAMLEIEFKKEDKSRNLTKIETFPFKNEFFGEVDVEEGFIEIFLPEIVNLE